MDEARFTAISEAVRTIENRRHSFKGAKRRHEEAKSEMERLAREREEVYASLKAAEYTLQLLIFQDN